MAFDFAESIRDALILGPYPVPPPDPESTGFCHTPLTSPEDTSPLPVTPKSFYKETCTDVTAVWRQYRDLTDPSLKTEWMVRQLKKALQSDDSNACFNLLLALTSDIELKILVGSLLSLENEVERARVLLPLFEFNADRYGLIIKSWQVAEKSSRRLPLQSSASRITDKLLRSLQLADGKSANTDLAYTLKARALKIMGALPMPALRRENVQQLTGRHPGVRLGPFILRETRIMALYLAPDERKLDFHDHHPVRLTRAYLKFVERPCSDPHYRREEVEISPDLLRVDYYPPGRHEYVLIHSNGRVLEKGEESEEGLKRMRMAYDPQQRETMQEEYGNDILKKQVIWNYDYMTPPLNLVIKKELDWSTSPATVTTTHIQDGKVIAVTQGT